MSITGYFDKSPIPRRIRLDRAAGFHSEGAVLTGRLTPAEALARSETLARAAVARQRRLECLGIRAETKNQK